MKLRKIGVLQNIKAFVHKKKNNLWVNTLGLNSGDDSVHLDTNRLMDMKKIDKKLNKI